MDKDEQIMLAAEHFYMLDAHAAYAISTFSSLLISKSLVVNWFTGGISAICCQCVVQVMPMLSF